MKKKKSFQLIQLKFISHTYQQNIEIRMKQLFSKIIQKIDICIKILLQFLTNSSAI